MSLSNKVHMCINAFRYAGQLSEQDVRLISEKPEVVHAQTLSWLTLLTEGARNSEMC